MTFRVTGFANQQSTKLAGWSINFWNLSSDRTFAVAQAIDLAQKLQGCTGAQAYYSALRVSAYPADRLPSNIPLTYSPSTVSGSAPDADYPTSSLQLILRGSPNYRATVWLSGIPDDIVTNSGRFIPTPSFTPRLKALTDLLLDPAKQWGLNVLNRGILKRVVTGLVTATGALKVPAHGWGAEGTVTRIRVTGFSKPLVVNKIWRVTVIDADTVQLNFWTGLSDPQVSGNNPQAQQQLYTQVAMQSALPGAATKHNRGRPVGLLGGRRRRRKT